MTDTVSPEKRSEVMSRVRSRDSQPELLIRKGLHRRGFRYRLHDRKLPGKPDLVFAKFRAIILVNGCFWHGHACPIYRFPKSNTDYWRWKIAGNISRDAKNAELLVAAGWRILIIWECAIKRKARLPLEEVLDTAAGWLLNGKRNEEIAGIWRGRTDA